MALSLPIVLTILAGLWEVGRITEVQQIIWNGTREAARDASLGEDNLQTIGSSLLTYLQNAERTTFGQGHSTSMISPVVTLPANTTGYTCWDNTANQEIFTITFTDLTNTSVTDPTSHEPARSVPDRCAGSLQKHCHQPPGADHRDEQVHRDGGLGIDG